MDLRTRIVDSAFELFSVNGYEKTTVDEIINLVGSSKGGFYHHFKSKEEIIEVIVDNLIGDLSNRFKSIATNKNDPFLEKMNMIFLIISQYKKDQITEWSKVNNLFNFQGNEKILRKLEKQFKSVITAVFLELINIGNARGEIIIKYPESSAEFCARELLWLYEAIRMPVYSDDLTDYQRYLTLLEFNEELISYVFSLEEDDLQLKYAMLDYLHHAKEAYCKSRE